MADWSEKLCINAVQVVGGTTALAAVLCTVNAVYGLCVSVLTGGTFTTLHAAILFGPVVFPVVKAALIAGTTATLALAALTLLSTCTRCTASYFLLEQPTFTNWQVASFWK
jgi:hypothetical protein